MKMEIGQDVIQRTSKCEKDFRCLSGYTGHLCRILCYMKEDIYFVKCMEKVDCAYLETHEKTRLCNCPVRKEIYQRYKI